MSINYTQPLLIGEIQSATSINDDGVRYIAVGRLTGDDEEDEESAIGMDEIEARALYEWLGRVLSSPDPTTADKP